MDNLLFYPVLFAPMNRVFHFCSHGLAAWHPRQQCARTLYHLAASLVLLVTAERVEELEGRGRP